MPEQKHLETQEKKETENTAPYYSVVQVSRARRWAPTRIRLS